MKPDSRRIQKQNDLEYSSGKVLYWMNRDMRLQDNWALLRAQELAKEHDVELIVCYNLDPEFLGGTLRQLDFKIQALKELHVDFEKHNIPFYTLVDSDVNCIIDFIEKHKVGYVVTDFAPLRIQRKWLDTLIKKAHAPIEVVDTHNIVPLWEASEKKEFAAYTIRPKIQKKLKDFLTDFPKVQKQKEMTTPGGVVISSKYSRELVIPAKAGIQDFAAQLEFILNNVKTNRNVLPVSWCTAGEKSAHKVLKHFITSLADEYSTKRNDPVADVQSNLSPYLHYGMIAPQRVALDVQKAQIPFDSKKDFLEELIIRRELADNFCFYEKNYDTPEGFHEFFQNEHERIKNEKREYLYTKKQFEHAQTHDDLWNACQTQMIKTGKMHGYLRMYWAKMIFAWTKDVNEAMKIAVYLNDTYELDGRDPNGYTGIAWCIGGVHDRPWFITNTVFGKLRYMSRGGMDKKFDTKAYIEKWSQDTLL
jgi:deoxyribodipyrimidine photo-lyase